MGLRQGLIRLPNVAVSLKLQGIAEKVMITVKTCKAPTPQLKALNKHDTHKVPWGGEWGR